MMNVCKHTNIDFRQVYHCPVTEPLETGCFCSLAVNGIVILEFRAQLFSTTANQPCLSVRLLSCTLLFTSFINLACVLRWP